MPPSEGRRPKGIDIVLGRSVTEDSQLVRWNSESVINGHWAIIGSSGTGKTYTLRRILKQLVRHPGIRLHLIDLSGDLSIGNPEVESIVKFSENTTHGLNPFEIDPDLDFGGVRRTVARFLSMVDRYTSPKLGARQQKVLRTLIYDMLEEYGYYYDRPESWSSNGKGQPSMQTLKEFIDKKYLQLSVGGNSECFKALKAFAKQKEAVLKGIEQGIPKVDIDGLKANCLETYEKFLDTIQSPEDLKELRRYSDPDVLESIANRIDNLYHTGIFRDQKPTFSRARPLWVYDITSLQESLRGFFVEIYLSKIFARARRNGISPNSAIREIVLIDEAQHFVNKDPDSIINIVMREGRKWGLSLCFATQRFDLLSIDVITNCACKLILGLDEFEHIKSSRQLGIPIAKIKGIHARHTGLVQIKTHDSQLKNGFTEVNLRES